jgi:hypothetical protein
MGGERNCDQMMEVKNIFISFNLIDNENSVFKFVCYNLQIVPIRKISKDV